MRGDGGPGPSGGAAAAAQTPGVLPVARAPGGNWKGTGTPSWTEEPSGRASLVLSESSTLSSMLFRKLLL